MSQRNVHENEPTVSPLRRRQAPKAGRRITVVFPPNAISEGGEGE
jgi:hypothetical protein